MSTNAIQVRDRIHVINPKHFVKWRPLRTAYFMGIVACAMEDFDRTYEYEPRLGIDLRKHLPEQVVFDGMPTAPWRAGLLRRRQMVLYFGDPMFGRPNLRNGNGADAKPGPDHLAESLRHPDFRDTPLPYFSEDEFAACESELDLYSNRALPDLERALAEGLVEVSGMTAPTTRGMPFDHETFRAPLTIDALHNTIVAGSLQITAVEVRIDPVVAAGIVTTDGDSETSNEPDAVAGLVEEMRQRKLSGSTIAEAAEALARRVPSDKPDVQLRSLTKRLTGAYYKKYPRDKLS